MTYTPEITQKEKTVFTQTLLQEAYEKGHVLQARALLFDKNKNLRFMLNGMPAVMPFEECSDGLTKEGTALACVGRMTSFVIQSFPDNGASPIVLSRAMAQKKCKADYLDTLSIGDVITCRITRLETFGAFCDVGCGIAALLPIDCMSVSRISHPSDRLCAGQVIDCVVKNRDEQGRLVLSLKELLGTWQENAENFVAGETALGVVRSIEPYGVFIELAPNLSGLAEYSGELVPGQLVSVFIKNILPDKHKIKLAILRTIDESDFHFPIKYFTNKSHIENWQYI